MRGSLDLLVPADTDLAGRRAPDIVTGWTEVVRALAPGIETGKRACNFGPWSAAIDAAFGPLPDDVLQPSHHLQLFAECSAAAPWPAGRTDLVEWALTFLEADVMLFRSGYAKKKLLTRLRQSPPQRQDCQRIEALVRRAVMGGCGLEEQREYRRLAARIVCSGDAPGLRDWLEDCADGAVLSWDKADTSMMADLRAAALSEQDRARLQSYSLLLRPRWGVVYPQMDRIVRLGGVQRDLAQMRRFDAYRVLAVIRQREGSTPAA